MEPVVQSGTGPERPSVRSGIGGSLVATGSVVPLKFLKSQSRLLRQFAPRQFAFPRHFAVALALICAIVPPLYGEVSDDSLEFQVKAVFLLNFTKFIEWPPTVFGSPDSPVSICILGEDPFGSVLDRIVAGEVVNGRHVTTQRIKRAPPAQACQIVFAGGTAKDALKTLSGLGPGVLTVGDGEAFARDGGMIAFVIENRRVRFDINQTAAEKAGLKLSSKLLSVARAVEK